VTAPAIDCGTHMTNAAKLFNDALAALNSRKHSLAETAFRKVLGRQPHRRYGRRNVNTYGRVVS
jgi:outer membrane protein assembly factor BamD (BamD/ComL family)